MFRVSGIPAVKAFRDGRVVAEFVGARSPTAVSAFVDDLLAPPKADLLIEELRSSGELPEVLAALDRDDVTVRSPGSSAPCPMPGTTSATACARWQWRCSTVSAPTIRSSIAYRKRLAAALY